MCTVCWEDVTVPTPSIDALVARVVGLLDDRPRIVVGIAGAPGSGKSSLARKLTRRLETAGVPAVQVPMDGFHLADVTLDALGLRHRKGAIETFDAHGYVALLRRLLDVPQHAVHAPGFERRLEQPVAAAVTVPPTTRVVVTEGNYLLDAHDPWPEARALMAEVWYVELDENRRRSRLVERHVASGKNRAAAQAWVDDVDEPNAQRVRDRRERADLVIATD